MSYVVTLSGSPSIRSRTAHLLCSAEQLLQSQGFAVRRIDVRALPAEALLRADASDKAIEGALEVIAKARAVVIATPVYNASYSGLLKTFLDLLPRMSFSGKPVLPISTGGSVGHMLAIDYALKPVLSALGARHQIASVFACDDDIPKAEGEYCLSLPIESRLAGAIFSLARALDDAESLDALRSKPQARRGQSLCDSVLHHNQ